MFKVDLAGFFVFLVDREIDDPGKGETVFIRQTQFGTDNVTGTARDTFEGLGLAAKEERGIAHVQTQLLADRLGTLWPDVLGQRARCFHAAFDLTGFQLGLGFFHRDAQFLCHAVGGFLAPEDIAHAGQPFFLRKGVHAVAELAAAADGRGDGADFGAFLFQQFREDRKAGVAEMVGHDLHLDRVTQVGLVRAIPQRRVFIRDLRPFLIHSLATTEFFENAGQHRLDGVEHVLLFDKGHLEVELVEIGGRPVSARVFVAETGRDLEILVKAGHHQQLFELLRGLRQSVELARVQTRRHKEVARAFGGRRGDNRRLEFLEILVPHALSDRRHNIGPQHHVVLHFFATQVEVAIAQAGFLGVFLIAKNLQRQLFRGPQHFDVAHENFDLAGGDLGVDQIGVAGLYLAINADTPFRPHLFHLGKDGGIRVA